MLQFGFLPPMAGENAVISVCVCVCVLMRAPLSVLQRSDTKSTMRVHKCVPVTNPPNLVHLEGKDRALLLHLSSLSACVSLRAHVRQCMHMRASARTSACWIAHRHSAPQYPANVSCQYARQGVKARCANRQNTYARNLLQLRKSALAIGYLMTHTNTRKNKHKTQL